LAILASTLEGGRVRHCPVFQHPLDIEVELTHNAYLPAKPRLRRDGLCGTQIRPTRACRSLASRASISSSGRNLGGITQKRHR
jgi:hypothetical protein